MSRIAPTFPATQATPNSTSVVTQTGLTQGDLVYFNNGDYKPPSSLTAPSAISFNAPQPQLIMSGGVGGIGTPVFSVSDLYTNNNSGSSISQSMVVLTNGNIVQVFVTVNNNYPSFRIVNSSGTIVVSTTAISTSGTFGAGNSNISVCALTGGGFAVMWNNTNNDPSYAIYTNSGTVTTAATADALPPGSGYSGGNFNFAMTALANGGFAVLTQGSDNVLYFKIYTSTGGTTLAWTSAWNQNQGSSYGIASRSDSSICIVGWYTSGTYLAYAVYSATGSSIVSAPTSTGITNTNAQNQNDVICLSNGTTFVISYYDSIGNISCKFLPTGNTLSSATTILKNLNTNSQSGFCFLRTFARSSGGFAIFVADSSDYTLYVGFSNSTATNFYPATNGNGLVPLPILSYPLWSIPNNSYTALKGTVYENGGNIYFAFPNSNSPLYNYNYISINESTYAINTNSSTTSLSTSSPYIFTSVAPGSAVLSTSTPTKISYYPASSLTAVGTQSPAVVLSPTIITSTGSTNISSITLSDGRFAIGYISSLSPYNVTVNVFSSSGSLLQTLSPGNAGSGSTQMAGLKLFSLSSGKLGVAFSSSSGTGVAVYIYNSSYSVTYSANPISVNATYPLYTSYLNNDAYGWGIAGNAATDQIAFFYTKQSPYYSQVQIYDNTLTQITNFQVGSYQNQQVLQATPTQNGGFIFSFYYSNTQYFYSYHQTSATSYTAESGNAVSITGAYPAYPNIKPFSVNGNNVAILPVANTNTTLAVNWINLFGTANIYSEASLSTNYSMASSNGQNAFGSTGYGSFVFASTQTASNSGGILYIYSGILSNSFGESYPVSQRLTVSGLNLPTNCQLNITSGPGYSCVISWVNSNTYPTYMIVNTAPIYVPYTLTAGSTVSNPVTISPSPVPSTSAVNNSVLVGVANNTASAGTSASITTNGPATLNTNYSASTAFQSFDYQTPNGTGIQGVKGTIVGRNVNLTGNN